MADVIDKLKTIDEDGKVANLIENLTKETVESLEGMYE